MQYAKANNLWLIDDAAQSFGASLNRRRVGTLAHVTCTSFFPAKPPLLLRRWRVVFTDDDSIAEIIQSCRVHGMGRDNHRMSVSA